jgi:hypothetical protein
VTAVAMAAAGGWGEKKEGGTADELGFHRSSKLRGRGHMNISVKFFLSTWADPNLYLISRRILERGPIPMWPIRYGPAQQAVRRPCLPVSPTPYGPKAFSPRPTPARHHLAPPLRHTSATHRGSLAPARRQPATSLRPRSAAAGDDPPPLLAGRQGRSCAPATSIQRPPVSSSRSPFSCYSVSAVLDFSLLDFVVHHLPLPILDLVYFCSC